jgi:DNA-binding MarR family transcriptional regulator
VSKKVDRNELIAAVMQAVAEFQDATDLVDEAAAARLGLNRTDLRCLGMLARGGAMTAGELAKAAGLTPGAATTAVDRLARAGYARRIRDVGDRRRVTIEPTAAAHTASDRIWGPIGREAHDRLAKRSTAELVTIHAFLEEGASTQSRHAERIKAATD